MGAKPGVRSIIAAGRRRVAQGGPEPYAPLPTGWGSCIVSDGELSVRSWPDKVVKNTYEVRKWDEGVV